MPKGITLKDVAKHAGVSYQTVSKVLRDEIKVSSDTRARIEAAVAELGYKPDTAGRSLRTKTNLLIGYSWKPNFQIKANPILEQFLRSIVQAAEQSKYHIMLFPYRIQDDMLTAYRDLIRTNRIDGFILSNLNYDDPRIELLLELDFPFVAFGRSNPEWKFFCVDVDGRVGLRMATHHLVDQGHKRIAVLAWPPNSSVGDARLNGYLEAMQEASLPIDKDWILRGEGAIEFGYQATNTLLDLPETRRPTGIVTIVDSFAIGAMRAVTDRGFIIGSEIGITGFDDSPFVQCLSPGLTSLRQPIDEVGHIAVKLLVDILNGNQPEEQQILLAPELIIRGSSLGFKGH